MFKKNNDKNLSMTTYYLSINKKTAIPEKIIFVTLSNSMKELGYEILKEYKWTHVKDKIFDEDLKTNLSNIKKLLGKDEISFIHRFMYKNYFYLVKVNLICYSEDEKYFVYYGKNEVINNEVEDKLFLSIMLKNNNKIMLVKEKNNKYEFVNFEKNFNKEELKEIKELVILNLKNLSKKLDKTKNVILNLKQEEILTGNFSNLEKYKNLINYQEIKIENNKQVLLFDIIYFKFFENIEETKYYLFVDKTKILFYQFFYEIIKFLILNKENISNNLLIYNKKNKINYEDKIIFSNLEYKRYSKNKNFITYVINLKNKKIFVYIKKIFKNKEFFNHFIMILEQIFNRLNEEITSNQNLELLKNIIDNIDEWVLITDHNKKIIYVNNAVKNISGYSKEEILEKTPKIFCSGKMSTAFYEKFYKSLNKKGYYEGIFLDKKKNNEEFYLYSKIYKVNFDDKYYYVALGKDITDNILKEQNSSEIDKLTKLYNRKGILNLLKNKKFKYIYIIDIADFKLFNYINGNKKGDELLVKVSEYLKKEIGNNGIIARDYADIFLIFSDLEENKIIDILDSFNKGYYDNKKTKIFFNIGKYKINEVNIKNEDILDLIINKARIALNLAKNEGLILENTLKSYNEELGKNELEKDIEAKLLIEKGLEKKGFLYHYQPIVKDTGEIVGVEALIRLKLDNKIYYPGSFIDYAERTNYISYIDKITVDKIFEDFKTIKLDKNFFISYNLSVSTINLQKIFTELMKKINNSKLNFVFEITERTPLLSEYIDLLNKKNLKVAIDDFGTGYSSLIYLANLKINKLKIDKFFIDRFLVDKKIYYIIETILDFTKKLNIDVVAEGVENKEQYEVLKKLGCNYFQGYYFYKPLSFEKLLEALKTNKK